MGSSGRDKEHLMSKMEAQSVERGLRRTIVAAVDESAQADDVFDFVRAHFNCPDTTVVFTHVAKPLDSLFNSFAVKASEAQSKRYLAEGWVKRAEDSKVEFKSQAKVLVGDAREELCTFCEHVQPDALIMGSHGRKGLSRLMLGSVSDYCVHFCSCPVIVVKPKKDAKPDESGYSSVVRLAALNLGMGGLLKDKAKADAAEALHEIATKEEGKVEGEKAGEIATEEGGKAGEIVLEQAVPMGSSPFVDTAPPKSFPEADPPFPTPMSAA